MELQSTHKLIKKVSRDMCVSVNFKLSCIIYRYMSTAVIILTDTAVIYVYALQAASLLLL